MAPDIVSTRSEERQAGSGEWTTRISLTRRILAVNIFALAILAGGFFYLDSYRARLIDGRLVTIGREAALIAAAIETAPGEDRPRLLERTVRATGLRVRIYDKAGHKVADSFALTGPTYELRDPRSDPIHIKIARGLDRVVEAIAFAAAPPFLTEPTDDRLTAWPEAREALAKHGPTAAYRFAPDRTPYLSAARPLGDRSVLLATANARDITEIVRAERLRISLVLAAAIVASVLLSLFLARTIVLPLRRLARAAVRVRLGRAREVIVPRLPERRDEIGMLARAISDMSQALRQRIDATDAFAADAIGESLGASALRIAGGIFTKIADIGSDLMKIVFKIKEDDARNPGVIADCTGDNAGDSVGPSADGFETYGVTGVALISFILLAVASPTTQIQLLVWIFMMRIVMVVASGASYLINEAWAKSQYANVLKMNYEHPLTRLVWLTSIVSVILTYATSYVLIPDLGDASHTLWWKLSTIITCGTLAGAIIPELVKIFTSTESSHTREVVTSSREGGASLNILSGLVAGNFSAYWLGMTIMLLMAVAYWVSLSFGEVGMIAPAVFAFGLVAFGFLGMGPVTIAVDSYGPVTDNAQSVYELSQIEQIPNIKAELKKTYGYDVDFERAKHNLEENDGAGNTFKATAKPVLIGTAVVGATTMIFSIVVMLTHGLQPEFMIKLSLMHPPFLLGLITGGAMIYWFTGASTQAVTTGAYRAVEFIKANIKLEGSTKASVEDSKKVVEICTKYAQKGMFNIFMGVFFGTLAFAFFEPFFFIGYLVSIALFGLYQAIFMANAGGAWDNAKKIVEVELKEKGTPLHDATVVGDTVGDPFKDTSSVAMNPVIKFTTLFGLLAVELAVSMAAQSGTTVTLVLAGAFLLVSAFFVHRSFYGMRIGR